MSGENIVLGGSIALIGIVAVMMIAMICLSIASSFHSVPNQTFTITGKENVRSGDGSKYLVYTDKTTYEVEDSWIWGRWNSSDVYGRLVIGKSYSATLQGYRIPFFSMYPNIIEPVEIKKEEVEK
jgi:hypothetical protein